MESLYNNAVYIVSFSFRIAEKFIEEKTRTIAEIID